MKRIIHGLFTNSEPINTPNNENECWLFDGLNLNIDKKSGSVYNEEGFDLHLSFDSEDVPISYLSLDTGEIIFLVYNYSGEHKVVSMGLNKALTTILKDAAGSPVLNFSLDYPIKGFEYKYNYKRDVIVTWTDRNEKPRYLNITNPQFPSGLNASKELVNTTEKSFLSIWADVSIPQIDDIEVRNTDGNLKSGAYFISYAYEDSDNNIGNYLVVDGPIYIIDDDMSDTYAYTDGCEAGTITNKSIEFQLKNIDTNYSKLHIAIIKRIGGTIEAVKISSQVISTDTLNVIYNGQNETTVDYSSIVVPQPSYDKAGVIATHKGQLLMGDLVGTVDIGYQKYANNIKPKMITDENVKLNDNANNHKNSRVIYLKRSHMSGEVVAFYIVANLKDGTKSMAYHIPGRERRNINVGGESVWEDDYVSDHKAALTYLEEDYDIDHEARYFQMRDTSDFADNSFGYWQNEDETYPDTDDFDIYDDTDGYLGTLRGERVRHSKMPEFSNMIDNGQMNAGNINEPKLIGVYFEDIKFPASLQDKIASYEIFYAKRDGTNCIVQGQTIIIHPMRTGGGYDIYLSVANNCKESTEDVFECLPFDLMASKRNINVNYISCQALATGYINFTNVSEDYYGLVNYWLDGSVFAKVNAINKIRKVTGIGYFPKGIYTTATYGSYITLNIPNTSYYIRKGQHKEKNIVGVLNNPLPDNNPSLSMGAGGYTAAYLVNLNTHKRNCYRSFQNQELVSTGIRFDISEDTTDPLYKGDCFWNDYSVRMYAANYDTDTLTWFHYYVAHRYMCLGAYNANLRHEGNDIDITTGDMLQRYYPKLANGAISFTDWIKIDFTYYGYNTDYSLLNDNNPIIPFSEENESSDINFPTMILASQPNNKESRQNNWKNFLANNYYELSLNKGRITNIVSFKDEILIHTTTSLFRTVGSKQLKIEEITTYIGTGDIFGVDPIEQSVGKIPILGLQDKSHASITPHGYVFGNTEFGKVFLYDGRAKEISAIGNSDWFRENFKFNLKEVCRDYLSDFDMPINNPLNDKYNIGGLTLEYDPVYNRMIFSLINYDFADGMTFAGYYDAGSSYGANDIFLYDSPIIGKTHFYRKQNGILWPVTMRETAYFKDTSKTIIYSLNRNEWGGFHIYKPHFICNDGKNIYSGHVQRTNALPISTFNLFRHNSSESYCKFYDQVAKESYIEIVINNGIDYDMGSGMPNEITKILDALAWITNIKQSDGSSLISETFTHALIYTWLQNSGLVALSISSNVKYVGGEYRFNNFKDIVINPESPHILLTKGLESSDKIVSSNLDDTKHWSKKGLFRDKFFIVRLIYDNENQRELSFEGLRVHQQPCNY